MKIVQCNWCKGDVIHRQLQRHFRDDCSGLPPLNDDQRVCSVCQSIALVQFFPISESKRGGRDHTCLSCHADRSANARRHPGRPPKKIPLFRPGKWVLRACGFCGERFNARQMIRHKPRCPKKPPTQNRAMKDLAVMTGMAEAKSLVNHVRSAKRNNLKFFYGMSLEEFESKKASQEGKCAICGRFPEGLNRRTDSLHVDHDHTTNVNRGLLCHFCNVGLGHFRDDPALLVAAVDYLTRHKSLSTVA